jgi:hypothetical protein
MTRWSEAADAARVAEELCQAGEAVPAALCRDTWRLVIAGALFRADVAGGGPSPTMDAAYRAAAVVAAELRRRGEVGPECTMCGLPVGLVGLEDGRSWVCLGCAADNGGLPAARLEPVWSALPEVELTEDEP